MKKDIRFSIPQGKGHSKKSKKEFLRYLYISRGSLEELRYFLLLSKDLGYMTEEAYNTFESKLTEISYLLNQLIKSLTSKTSTSSNPSTTSTPSTTSKTSKPSKPPQTTTNPTSWKTILDLRKCLTLG